MLVFSDPGCGPCTALLPEVARWQRDYPSKLAIAVISRGTPEVNRAKSTEHGLTHVLLQQDREVAEAYKAHGTPSAVLIRSDGTIGSGLAAGAEAIRELVARTTGTVLPTQASNGNGSLSASNNGANGNGTHNAPIHPIALKIGDPVPALKLPDLNGKLVDLADFCGKPTLVLFWNPGCGFCQRMLEDLKVWERQKPVDAPQLLVISTGTIEANRSMGLKAPIVLDQSFTVGLAFGVGGTPSAVLVDGSGVIATETAIGAQAILALAHTKSFQTHSATRVDAEFTA
jgi:peroxiredoxin